MAGVFTADDKMEKRKKNVREYLLIAYSTYFSTQKKQQPETSRLKELKDKKKKTWTISLKLILAFL